jgi:hypothetical protein
VLLKTLIIMTSEMCNEKINTQNIDILNLWYLLV